METMTIAKLRKVDKIFAAPLKEVSFPGKKPFSI
jgi:hypothetical protein